MSDEEFPAEALRRALVGVQRKLRRQRAAHGVSPSKLVLMGRLFVNGEPMPAAELARIERVQPQSLTRSLAELEQRGLIRRTQSAADRRQWLISLTEAGMELLRADARAQSAWLAQAASAVLTPDEQGLLGRCVQLLARLAL